MSGGVSHETNCFSGNIALQIEQKRLGRRKQVRHGGTLCSGCYAEPPVPGQRYGKKCHAAAVLASSRRRKEELKRLRALDEQQKLSKGKDNGQSERSTGDPPVPGATS